MGNLRTLTRNKLALILVISLVINSILGIMLFQTRNYGAHRNGDIRKDIQKYPHISVRVLQEFQNDILVSFNTLRSSLRKEAEPWGSTFGLYFEYLSSGTNIGINSSENFYGASLVKVPFVMALMRNVEKGEVDLTKKVRIEPRYIDDRFGNLWMRAGQEITLEEAVRLVLTESDNTAFMIVRDYISEEDLVEIYEGLDMELMVQDNQAIFNAKGYSSILKALYFSSILREENSEMILNYLVQSVFDDKLVAGVPDNVEVSNKIGILSGQLYSDCGIVYVPKRPYMLCMVSVSDEETARLRMQRMSKIVYDYVSSANRLPHVFGE